MRSRCVRNPSIQTSPSAPGGRPLTVASRTARRSRALATWLGGNVRRRDCLGRGCETGSALLGHVEGVRPFLVSLVGDDQRPLGPLLDEFEADRLDHPPAGDDPGEFDATLRHLTRHRLLTLREGSLTVAPLQSYVGKGSTKLAETA